MGLNWDLNWALSGFQLGELDATHVGHTCGCPLWAPGGPCTRDTQRDHTCLPIWAYIGLYLGLRWYLSRPFYVGTMCVPPVFAWMGLNWIWMGPLWWDVAYVNFWRGLRWGPNGQLYVGTMCAPPVYMSLNQDPNGFESLGTFQTHVDPTSTWSWRDLNLLAIWTSCLTILQTT